MPDPVRIDGAKLTLTVGTVELNLNATSARLSNEEKSAAVLTFADALAGLNRQYFILVTSIQSTSVGSFWRLVWDNVPGTLLSFTLRPHGNAVATAEQPHFTVQVKLGPKPDLGGEAGIQVTQTFETRLEVEGVPLLKTTA